MAYDDAAARAVRDLDPLAGPGEHHRVVTDDVAAANRRKPDRARTALPGVTFARIYGEFVERAAERRGDDFTHFQCGARRRVDLVPMVGFDDLDVVVVAEHARGQLDQLEGRVDADAHVGCKDNRDALACGPYRALAGIVEAGGADHHLYMGRDARIEVTQRRFGPGEVDQYIGARQCRKLGHDARSGGPAHRFSTVTSEHRAVGAIERHADRKIRLRQRGFYQHLAHPAGCAGDRKLHRGRRPCGRWEGQFEPGAGVETSGIGIAG